MRGETENPARSAITLGIPGRSGAQGSFLAEPGTGPAAGKPRRAERVLVRFRECAPPAREPGDQCGRPGTRAPLISRGVSFGIAVFYRIEHSQATVTWRSGPRRPDSLRRGAVSRGAQGLARVGGAHDPRGILPLGQDEARDWGAWGGTPGAYPASSSDTSSSSASDAKGSNGVWD